MSLPSYKEALKMGKEKLRVALVPSKVNKAKKQAELEMCKLDEEIATKVDKLQDICTGEDIRFENIIELQDDIAILERKKAQYQTILDEMFPEE